MPLVVISRDDRQDFTGRTIMWTMWIMWIMCAPVGTHYLKSLCA